MTYTPDEVSELKNLALHWIELNPVTADDYMYATPTIGGADNDDTTVIKNKIKQAFQFAEMFLEQAQIVAIKNI